MILGLRTVIYKVDDLAKAKDWYARAFEVEPYFDQTFYVGFNIGGFELGLDPDISDGLIGAGGSVAYWGVDAIGPALDRFLHLGSVLVQPIKDVGDGIKVAVVTDPFANFIGLIENPHFGAGG
jgi:predicted enzyme related to lactoylglutathione lyase